MWRSSLTNTLSLSSFLSLPSSLPPSLPFSLPPSLSSSFSFSLPPYLPPSALPASPLKTSDGSSAVHLAASVGAVSLLELMLLNGASADQGDFEGRLPLHWATMPHSAKGIDLIMKVS